MLRNTVRSAPTAGVFSASLVVALAVAVPVARPAQAADLPKGTATDAPASKGTTEVTKEGFQAAGRIDAASKDATELSIGAGGLSSGGNSRLLALTASSTLRVRREANQLSALAAANYSRTAPPGAEQQTVIENIQGRARYDRFVASDIVVFLGVQARRDRFAGLDVRLQVDPGLGYYFVNEPSHLLWTELGYDFLYDVRRDDAITGIDPKTKAPFSIDKTMAYHSGRLFVGYDNKINEQITFTAGIEYLQGFKDLDIFRVNGDAALSSKIAKKFSVATAFAVRFDHKPLPGKEKVDTVTSVNLVYSIF